MPPPVTTTSAALLGLLNLRSWSTYELTKQARRSLAWFWPRAERKLYQEAKVLAACGLATATTGRTGKRPRTVYAITDEGRRELAQWLSQPAEPRTTAFALALRVFFADAGTREQLHANLEAMETEALTNVGALATMARELRSGSAFPDRLHLSAVSLRLQLDQELAVLAWVRWARQQTRRWTSTRDAGRWGADRALDEVVRLADEALAAAPDRARRPVPDSEA